MTARESLVNSGRGREGTREVSKKASFTYFVRLAKGGLTGVGAGEAVAKVAAVARTAMRVLTNMLTIDWSVGI